MQFRDFLKEQLEKEPEFKQFWLARNAMFFGHPAEAISLAEMDLSSSERGRVKQQIESPEFENRLDELLEEYL